MPLYIDSSTIFGSTITIWSVRGSCWNSSPVMIEFRHTLLPAPVAPATSKCGMRVRSLTNGWPFTSTPSGTLSAASLFSYAWLESTSRRYTVRRRGFGISTPTVPRPGSGAMTRIRDARMASARSSSSETMLPTLIPAAGSNSNMVTTGPGWISVTRPSTAKSASLATSRFACIVRSAAVTRSSGWSGNSSKDSGGKASVGTGPAGRAASGFAERCRVLGGALITGTAIATAPSGLGVDLVAVPFSD